MAFSPDGQRIAVAVATRFTGLTVPGGERATLPARGGERTGRVGAELPAAPRAAGGSKSTFTPRGTLVTSAYQGETTAVERDDRPDLAPFPDRWPLRPLARRPSRGPRPEQRESRRTPARSLAVLDLRTGRHRSLEALPARAWIIALAFTPDGNEHPRPHRSTAECGCGISPPARSSRPSPARPLV